ncbi:MAG: MerR family transcriptional regulator [Thermoflavifilum sp.]|nr:MerR family transcriptional regulator [Thermoflavifilum sp.]MCL6514088.1 MerR family transcriptional regulator [Alicyclobacillus sp.]
MDGQAPNLWTVEQVVKHLGITPRTLRYYEELGLITPAARTPGGHRLYDEATVAEVAHILRLKDTLGFPLREIQQLLAAERQLQALRESYHRQEAHPEARRRVLMQFRDVLVDVMGRIDEKMAALTALRERYAEKLARVDQRLRGDGGEQP